MKSASVLSVLLALTTVACGQGPGPGPTAGPGPTPDPWFQDGETITCTGCGVAVPSTVTGGGKGAGTANFQNYFINGDPLQVIGSATAPLNLSAGVMSILYDSNFAVAAGHLALATSLDFSGKTISGGTYISPALSGTVTGTGNIPNGVLVNSQVTIAGHAVALGGTQAIAAGDLSNGTSGSGAVALVSGASLANPAITGGTWNGLSITAFSGNTTKVATVTGSPTSGCASWTGAGNLDTTACSAVASVSGSGDVGVSPTTGNPVVSLNASGVSAGSYAAADVTVNARGIVTSAANGAFTKTPGGVATTLNRHAQSWASVVDYMTDAQVTGASSATTPLQAMFTSICGTYGPAGIKISVPGYARLKVTDISATCAVPLVGDQSGYRGSTIDFSGSASFGIKYERSGGVQNAPVSGWLQGVRLEHLNFYSSGGSGNTAIMLKGCQSCIVSDVTFTGNPWNGILIYGGENIALENLNDDYKLNQVAGSEPGLYNTMIEVYGDLAGKNAAGGACALGDCSTRVDDTFWRNVVHAGNGGNPVYYVHDMAFNTIMDHVYVENGNIALQVYCNVGFPSITYCPAEIIAHDFQAEGATNATCAVCISDANNVKFTQSYIVPNSPVTTAHNLLLSATNYSQAAGSGGFRWSQGTMFNSTASMIYVVGISDTVVESSFFSFGNSSGGTGSGQGAAIEYDGSAGQHKASNNVFCNAIGFGANGLKYGIKADSPSFRIQYVNNSFYGCATGAVLNNSSTPATVIGANNLGP